MKGGRSREARVQVRIVTTGSSSTSDDLFHSALGPPPQALRALHRWYLTAARDLPWRRDPTPYAVLVSETMLQQTTVSAVVPAFERWMLRFPTLDALAAAPLDGVLSCWSGLGYYQRARRLKAAAEELCELGVFPTTREQLLGLTGVGPYTAAAIASIAFTEPVLSIDTNVARVLLRYRGQSSSATSQRVHRELRAEIEPIFRGLQEHGLEPGQLNQALMELGATVCRARSASCHECPWKTGCRAHRQGTVMEIPAPKKPTPPKITLGRVRWVEHEGRVLLVRGTSLGLLSALFQPPISFAEADRGHPVERFLAALPVATAGVAQREESDAAPFEYRISGRLLRLQVDEPELQHPRNVAPASREASVETLWLMAQEILHGRDSAISSLTRRVFTKTLENRAVDRRSDGH